MNVTVAYAGQLFELAVEHDDPKVVADLITAAIADPAQRWLELRTTTGAGMFLTQPGVAFAVITPVSRRTW